MSSPGSTKFNQNFSEKEGRWALVHRKIPSKKDDIVHARILFVKDVYVHVTFTNGYRFFLSKTETKTYFAVWLSSHADIDEIKQTLHSLQ